MVFWISLMSTSSIVSLGFFGGWFDVLVMLAALGTPVTVLLPTGVPDDMLFIPSQGVVWPLIFKLFWSPIVPPPAAACSMAAPPPAVLFRTGMTKSSTGKTRRSSLP